MFTRVQIVLLIFIMHAPFGVAAQDMQLSANTSITGVNTNKDDSFENGTALTVFFDYSLNNWLALDVGLMSTDKSQDKVRSDIVGKYQASIITRAILLGIKPFHKFEAPFEVYARLGLQHWKTELEVEEYFGSGIPGGTDSAEDQGFGHYLSFGAAHSFTKKILMQVEISHFKQQDLFKGRSSDPFDLTVNSIGVGIGYRF